MNRLTLFDIDALVLASVATAPVGCPTEPGNKSELASPFAVTAAGAPAVRTREARAALKRLQSR